MTSVWSFDPDVFGAESPSRLCERSAPMEIRNVPFCRILVGGDTEERSG
jgi:hypothetical protein